MNLQACKNAVKKLLGKNAYNFFAGVYFTKSNPDFLKHTAQNQELKNKYTGKRCFIIGNGPSLKNVDLSQLADEYTFTVNQLPRNSDFEKLKTNFHIWADQRFFDLDLDKSEDLELFNVMKAVSTEGNRPIVFYKWAARELIEKTRLDEILDIRYFGDIGMDIPKFFSSEKVADVCKPLPIFQTVVHYGICLAVYMGFSDIYLLGCDCTGFITTAQNKLKNSSQAEYAYSMSEDERLRMERVSNKTSIRDELIWHADLFDTYDIIMHYCKKQGVKLYNATENTLLESVPKTDLGALLLATDENYHE